MDAASSSRRTGTAPAYYEGGRELTQQSVEVIPTFSSKSEQHVKENTFK